MRLVITESFEASGAVVADMFAATLAENPNALLGCATGSSVVGVYESLCEHHKRGLDFSGARTVNLDEYVGLGPGDPQSMAYFMQRHFFGKVNIAPGNITLIDGTRQPEQEAARLGDFLDKNAIDILMLGIGSNGHIGFNEPANVLMAPPHVVQLSEETIAANARFFEFLEQVPRRAVTIGMRDVVKSKQVVLIASGASKAKAIRRLFAADAVDPALPCSILRVCTQAAVVIDRELAKEAGLVG